MQASIALQMTSSLAPPAQWPPDYKGEFERRARIYNIMLRDEEKRRTFMLHYKYNCIDWINDWCVTFDPRSPTLKLMPFKLFPRQRDFVNFILSCYRDKAHGLVEKARDMGATWLCCAISVWLWLFWPGTVVGWGSLLAGNIDDRGNPKAIFLKIRQLIQYLPFFMRPQYYTERLHAPLMKILHPTGTQVIIGEGGDNVGRGGRTSIYFKDESAHYERPELIEAALGDNTDVQIDISSVNGSNNVFYRKRMAGEIWYPNVPPTPGKLRVFIFDWREHPGKSQDWYDARRKNAMEQGLMHILAQEVDRDYNASTDRLIISMEWVQAAVDAHKKVKCLTGVVCAGQDIADGGGDKNALCIADGVVLRYADCWGGEADAAAYVAIPICTQYGVKELGYDSIGVGAGFKGGINAMREKQQVPAGLRIYPWNAGAGVLDPEEPVIPNDPQSPTNEAIYGNLKAQSWFRMRARFFKTWRAVMEGAEYDPGELISLDSRMPRLQQLKGEFCQPRSKTSLQNGKTIVDKKANGATSPNLADAAVICYNPAREIGILDVL